MIEFGIGSNGIWYCTNLINSICWEFPSQDIVLNKYAITTLIRYCTEREIWIVGFVYHPISVNIRLSWISRTIVINISIRDIKYSIVIIVAKSYRVCSTAHIFLEHLPNEISVEVFVSTIDCYRDHSILRTSTRHWSNRICYDINWVGLGNRIGLRNRTTASTLSFDFNSVGSLRQILDMIILCSIDVIVWSAPHIIVNRCQRSALQFHHDFSIIVIIAGDILDIRCSARVAYV